MVSRKNVRWLRVLPVVALLIMCCSSLAVAYILPARYYISRFGKTRDSVKKISARQTVIEYKGTQKLSYKQKLFINTPGDIRIERYEKGKKIRVQVLREKSAYLWEKGKKTIKSARTPNPHVDFFALHSAGGGYGSLKRVLAALKVRYTGRRPADEHSKYREQKYVTLAWFQKRAALVLGSSFNNFKRNQFWMDKKRFYPVRFLGTLSSGGPKVDIRFLDYHKNSYGNVFPGRIEIRHNGKLVRQILTSWIKVNRGVPSSLFRKVP